MAMQTPAPQQQQFTSNMAAAPPGQGFNQMGPQGYQQQQPMTQNYPMQQQYSQQQYPQQGQQQMMGQHMYGPMMQQQGRYGAMGGQPGGMGGYGMGQGGYGPVHICGHLAPPNLPPPAYQAPCSGCQSRGGSAMAGDMGAYQGQQQGAMGNWQGSQMNMYQGGQQYGGAQQQQQQMNMMPPQGPMGYNMGMNNQYQNPMMPTGGMMPMAYPGSSMGGSMGGDVQCRDVSQSSQTKGGKSKASAKNNAGAPPTSAAPGCGTGSGTTSSVAGTKQQPSAAAGSEKTTSNTPLDTKPSETPAVDTKTNSKNFMKPDTYQRTLEYVQQCQSWSSTVVKEEVTSTTDQKPELNPNGTVAGYTGPGSQASVLPQSQSTTHQQQSNMQGSSTTSRFATPLPNALTETSNMVINDMTSSLSSLQEENKYLQMIQ